METDKNKKRIVEVRQVHLWCWNCSAKLYFEDYYKNRIQQYPFIICLICGRTVMTLDLNESAYKRGLLETRRFEGAVRKVCSVSGKTVQFVEKYAKERGLNSADLEKLAQKIVTEDWDFEP